MQYSCAKLRIFWYSTLSKHILQLINLKLWFSISFVCFYRKEDFSAKQLLDAQKTGEDVNCMASQNTSVKSLSRMSVFSHFVTLSPCSRAYGKLYSQNLFDVKEPAGILSLQCIWMHAIHTIANWSKISQKSLHCHGYFAFEKGAK